MHLLHSSSYSWLTTCGWWWLVGCAVHNFLDAFYLSRIGIRMLIGQYLELRKPPKPDYIGLVQLVSQTGPA